MRADKQRTRHGFALRIRLNAVPPGLRKAWEACKDASDEEARRPVVIAQVYEEEGDVALIRGAYVPAGLAWRLWLLLFGPPRDDDADALLPSPETGPAEGPTA